MAKRILLFFYLAVQTFLLCAAVPQLPRPRVLIRQIHVYYYTNQQTTHLHLTRDQDMAVILGCLRAADSHVPAEAPPSDSAVCTVQVCLSDGKQHIYQQVATEYFSKDFGPWMQINRHQGAHLWDLLRTLKTQSFQGAFLFCDDIFSFILKFSKIFDKCSKKAPLSFVRNGVIYLIVYSTIAFFSKAIYNIILINWYRYGLTETIYFYRISTTKDSKEERIVLQ